MTHCVATGVLSHVPRVMVCDPLISLNRGSDQILVIERYWWTDFPSACGLHNEGRMRGKDRKHHAVLYIYYRPSIFTAFDCIPDTSALESRMLFPLLVEQPSISRNVKIEPIDLFSPLHEKRIRVFATLEGVFVDVIELLQASSLHGVCIHLVRIFLFRLPHHPKLFRHQGCDDFNNLFGRKPRLCFTFSQLHIA